MTSVKISCGMEKKPERAERRYTMKRGNRQEKGRVIYIEEREDTFHITIAVCGDQVPDKQSLERVIQVLHADQEQETTS